MKTTKNTVTMKVYRLAIMVMMAVLPALMGAWQAQAVEYKNMYQGVHRQMSGYNGQASVPTVSFQSTSAYSGNWSQPEVSTINADGSVNEGAYMAHRGGMRKDLSGNPGTPDENDDDEEQQPIGDAVIPLMLLACAYAIYMVYRRKRVKTLEH